MLRSLWFLTLVTTAAIALSWLTDNPGTVLLQWQAYRVETSVAFLIVLTVLIATLTALAYRIFLALRRAPAQVSLVWRNRRLRQGYQALTKGMVAIAAGDANEAKRQEKLTQILLQELPLTMLFSAQTAQLNGDEKAAERFFHAMTEQTDTEFLGVRGLLNQALSQGKSNTALKLAKRAYQLRPNSEWVAAQLFDLQIANGLWLDAQITNDKQVRASQVNKTTGRRRRALLALQQGMEVDAVNKSSSAAKNFKLAYGHDPSFVPAVLVHADVLIEKQKFKSAVEVIQKAWSIQPHPDLVLPFWLGSRATDGLAILKATESLTAKNPNHQESLIALARASLKAQLWGEARKYLEAATSEDFKNDEARICRLWAELEESENQDTSASRKWLTRGSLASGDPAWVCKKCGNSVSNWSVLCGNCGLFDSLIWDRPRHVSRNTKLGTTNDFPLTRINN